MLEFFSYWLLLSLPVLLILLVNLKGKQRLIYSHTLLNDFQDRTLGDFLFRTFHLYYDVILDLVLAFLIALLLSGLIGFPAGKTAVCIDGSYSMLLGPAGRTPLDEALKQGEEGLPGKHDLFLLAFDPGRGRVRLFSLKKPPWRGGTEGFREMLTGSYSFFNQDYSVCADLLKRGYRRVLILSDHEAAPGGSVEMISVARGRPESYFYPRSAGYDFAAGVFRLTFLTWRLREPVTVSVYLEAEDAYVSVSRAQMTRSQDILYCVLPEAGLYRFAAGNLDYVLNLQKPVTSGRVEGKFSRVILEVLPQLEEGGGDFLVADLSYRESAPLREIRRDIRALGAFRRALITLLPVEDSEAASYIHPLASSLSGPGLTEFPAPLLGLDVPGADLFYQNLPGLSDPQTPIVYLSTLEQDRPPAYETLPEGRLSLKQRHLTSFLYTRGADWVPVNLAAEELFAPGREPPLRFTPPEPGRKLIFWLLVGCYLLKSGLLLLLSRPPAGT
jgi:hypothetical protein